MRIPTDPDSLDRLAHLLAQKLCPVALFYLASQLEIEGNSKLPARADRAKS